MPAPKYKDIQILREKLNDADLISSHILNVLHSVGSKGASDKLIHHEVLKALEIEDQYIDFYLNQNYLAKPLSDNCSSLKSKNLIGYNTKTSVWYRAKQSSAPLTPKERAYFKAKGFGAGWKRISKSIDAIEWIHNNLSPVEFEHLCISILKTHDVSVQITKKNPITGTDGGFDGEGEYQIDGVMHPIGMQAKKYSLQRMVDYTYCKEFVGSLFGRQWKHGFIITTGTFTKGAHDYVDTCAKQGIIIELIDQNRLIDIMITKTLGVHGFGIHKTDYGLIYMNEIILKKASATGKRI